MVLKVKYNISLRGLYQLFQLLYPSVSFIVLLVNIIFVAELLRTHIQLCTKNEMLQTCFMVHVVNQCFSFNPCQGMCFFFKCVFLYRATKHCFFQRTLLVVLLNWEMYWPRLRAEWLNRLCIYVLDISKFAVSYLLNLIYYFELYYVSN